MDERSILLMSEELRAAMGAGVKRLEEDVQEKPQSSRTIAVLGRLIRYASLKSGRSRLTFETQSSIPSLHSLQAPFDIHLTDKSVEMDLTVQTVKSVTVTRGKQTRYTLIVDAQTHR